MAPNVTPAMLTQQALSGVSTQAGILTQISEHVPELQWPSAVSVYDVMRKDGTISPVRKSLTLPIRGTSWHVIDAPDVRPEVATFVRNNLGLTEDGDTRMRRRDQGISWDSFLYHALLSLDFGHMFFEPVFKLGPPGPNDTLPPGTYAHLSAMAPILPKTIGSFNIDRAGNLVNIIQSAYGPDGKLVNTTMPAELLLAVVNDREGGDWTGQSIYRSAYKSWYLLDQLERLGVMIVERNGMGVPTGEYFPDSDRNALQRALSAMRAGDLSGGAFPAGTNVKLLGVDGTLVDPMPQITYHAQKIPKSMLAMFLDLGHDAGARNLGETFVDFFTMAINSVISGYEEIFTEGLSRRIVELNFGPDEAYPEIMADDITPQAPLTADTIAQLITAGALTVDPELEAFIRRQFNMPPAALTDPNAQPPEIPDDVIAVQAGGSSGSKMSGTAYTLDQRETLLARMRTRLGPRRR